MEHFVGVDNIMLGVCLEICIPVVLAVECGSDAVGNSSCVCCRNAHRMHCPLRDPWCLVFFGHWLSRGGDSFHICEHRRIRQAFFDNDALKIHAHSIPERVGTGIRSSARSCAVAQLLRSTLLARPVVLDGCPALAFESLPSATHGNNARDMLWRWPMCAPGGIRTPEGRSRLVYSQV